MKMTPLLRQETINTITDSASLKVAIYHICQAYKEQHPDNSGRFRLRNRHRHHKIANHIALKVSAVQSSTDGSPEGHKDDFPLIHDVLLSSGGGSLNACIYLAIEKYFELDPNIRTEFEQYRIMTALDAMSF